MTEKAGIDREEWIVRCASYFIEQGDVRRDFACDMAFECWCDAGPDEGPEELADSEMSYWSADADF